MAATQRERSEVPAPHRSIIPTVPGVPAGAAVLIAVVCTSIGFFIDASGGGKDLTNVFAAFYIIGCALAALVVRYRGLFTTMVTPPLLLFLAVPVAYQQLLGHSSTSLKDILLNLALPLMNRFPTMAIATVLALAIGLGRLVLHRNMADAAAATRARGRRAGKGSPVGERARKAPGSSASDALRRRARSQSPAADEEAATPTRAGRKGAGRVADRPPRVSAAASRTSERAAAPAASSHSGSEADETPAQRRDSDAPRRRRDPDAPRTRREADPARQRRNADAPSRHRDSAEAPSRHRDTADAPSRRPDNDPAPRRRDSEATPRRRDPDALPRQRGADQQSRQRSADPRQRGAGAGQPQRSAEPRKRPAAAAPAEQPRRPRPEYGDVPPHPRPNVRYRERDAGRIEH
ncbi:hypothetical protein ABIA39_005130 [Nocardia sp. GAS34]|uniref:DUF6542 domain-containing protein n=1 Tax=unclassified Nocardia TaxID=2637762 RepID=UPI003D1FC0A3